MFCKLVSFCIGSSKQHLSKHEPLNVKIGSRFQVSGQLTMVLFFTHPSTSRSKNLRLVLPDAQLLIMINIIVPRFFENDADLRTDAIAPTALENIPKPTPNVAPNHNQ